MKNIPFFMEFAEEDLAETAQMSSWLKFSPDSYILKEGDLGSSFWIILKGSVRVEKALGVGKPAVVLTVIPQGECFGEMSIISGNPRTASITANEEVFLYKIDGALLEKARDALQLKFYKKFSQILVARLSRSSERLVKK